MKQKMILLLAIAASVCGQSLSWSFVGSRCITDAHFHPAGVKWFESAEKR